MNVLVGEGHGSQIVFARAAVVYDTAGRSTLAGDLLTEADRRSPADGPLDVVLVAGDAARALLIRLPSGLSAVGVVAEEDAPYPLPPDVSVVAGVEGAQYLVPDAEWVIVDPRRGRVIVRPDAQTVARVQAGPERPRILLGAAHVPARTQSGAEIAVWAVVRSEAEIEEALAEGADGLVVPGESPLLGAGASSPEEQEAALFRAANAVGGGALALDASADQIDPETVVAVAARCRARWLLDPRGLPLPLADFREALSALVAGERDEERPAEMPGLVAAVSASSGGDGVGARNDLLAADEILLTAVETAFRSHDPVARLARDAGLPLRVRLGDEDLDAGVAEAAAVGAVGVIVVGGRVVARAKDLIRGQG